MAKEEREMIQDMENLITIDMEQTIQEDWARVGRSKYCPYFKRLKTDIIMETYWTDKDKDEKKKQLWARARCGNIWRGHEGRGGHSCRGCKVEKERAEHIENCVEFGRVLGMNVQDWWMGLRGQIDDRLLEKIKRIDEGPQED